MNAAKFAKTVVEKYSTDDIIEIAEKAGAKIIYEEWYPTTIGEFERETNTILVNLRALENNKNAAALEKIIVANGLGRFFAAENNLEKQDAERFAGEFAKAILE